MDKPEGRATPQNVGIRKARPRQKLRLGVASWAGWVWSFGLLMQLSKDLSSHANKNIDSITPTEQQCPTDAQYRTLTTFQGEYGRVTAAAPEDRVGAMWSVILSATFPVGRFAVEAQCHTGRGYTDRRGIYIRTPFLVVETKRAPRRGQMPWIGAAAQLRRYLRDHARDARAGRAGRANSLFNAVAIGTAVKFYTYDPANSTLSPLGPQPNEGYDVCGQAGEVKAKLAHITANN
ncbi:hypothetical protein BDW74DRAFT_182367 [Aspergillus multicolor]|uniref:uncharacterized protein n=1 Tax=Aspergillus multicolor TaxID=41759 RepID=UPI003CCDE89D